MPDEYLKDQTNLPEIPESFILLTVDPAADPEVSPFKVSAINSRIYERIFLKRPGGGFVQVTATDDDANPVEFLPIEDLPDPIS